MMPELMWHMMDWINSAYSDGVISDAPDDDENTDDAQ